MTSDSGNGSFSFGNTMSNRRRRKRDRADAHRSKHVARKEKRAKKGKSVGEEATA